MPFSVLTGSAAPLTQTDGHGATFSRLTSVHDARATGYEVVYAKTEAMPAKWERVRPAPPQASPTRPNPSLSEAIGRVVRRAERLGDALVEAGDDPMEKANIGFELLDALSELWEYREAREDNWGDLLNLMQCVLKHEPLELLPAEKRECIAAIISKYLASRPVLDDDVERALERLASAGFNPWVGLATP